MVAQKVKPNLQTFNTILKCLRRFYAFGRLPALQTLREMKAIGIGEGAPQCPLLKTKTVLTRSQVQISILYVMLGIRTLDTCNYVSLPQWRYFYHLQGFYSKLQHSFSILGTFFMDLLILGRVNHLQLASFKSHFPA